MKMNKIIDFLQKKVIRSQTSKVFLMISIISLILSMMNKTKPILLSVELFIYVSLAMAANCMIYGGCQVSSILILLVPFSLIVVNMLELLGFSKPRNIQSNQIKTIQSITNPAFLEKSDEEKEKEINKLKKLLKESRDKYIDE
jgi:flagellar motor component MotA